MRRRVVTGSVVSAAALLAGLLSANPGQAVGSGAPSSATPLLSVRRDPIWVARNLAAQRLQSALASALTAARIGRSGGPAGCLVVTSGDSTLFSLNGTEPLLPASSLKLLTGSAALDLLGPDYRLTTVVKAAGPPAGGAIPGDLYLVGGGDPLLMTDGYHSSLRPSPPVYSSLDALARQVRAAGVTRVAGAVVGDDSRYDSVRGIAGWEPQYLAEGDVGPLSALEVDDDILPAPAKTPAPSSKTSKPAPSTTTTVPPSKRSGTTDVKTVTPTSGAAPDPPATAASVFEALLERYGVTVKEPARSGRAPAGASTVTTMAGPPTAQVVDEMLEDSDDTTAELLVKEIGLRKSGQASTAAGLAAVRADLSAAGVPLDGVVQLDGSGLDRQDRVTCDTLAAVLRRAGTAGPLAAGLPVAGRSGTLADRLKSAPTAGRIEAKTGTLNGVSALSGFVLPPSGDPLGPAEEALTFALILNGEDYVTAQAQADRTAGVLAGYPQLPDIARLGP